MSAWCASAAARRRAKLFPPLLAAGLPLDRAARARRPAGARAAPRRRSGRLPRQRGQGRPGRRVLPAPPRAAVLRPQRRVRAALRLSRLEVRRRRHLRRHARRSRRTACSRTRSRSRPIRPRKAAASSGPISGRKERDAARRPTTNGCARPRRIATSRRPSRSATTCRRSKAASTPRTRRSCTT